MQAGLLVEQSSSPALLAPFHELPRPSIKRLYYFINRLDFTTEALLLT
jgi:hypothetical protein